MGYLTRFVVLILLSSVGYADTASLSESQDASDQAGIKKEAQTLKPGDMVPDFTMAATNGFGQRLQ